MSKLFVGIDPGKTGYISYYKDKQLGYFKISNNYLKLFYDLNEIYLPNNIVYLEKATAYKGQGTRSINTYLINFGALLGILTVMDFQIKLITPKEWQKYFGIKSTIKIKKGLDKKTRNMLRYRQRKDVKRQCLELASEVWGIQVKDHNLADSLLILKYCIDKEE